MVLRVCGGGVSAAVCVPHNVALHAHLCYPTHDATYTKPPHLARRAGPCASAAGGVADERGGGIRWARA